MSQDFHRKRSFPGVAQLGDHLGRKQLMCDGFDNLPQSRKQATGTSAQLPQLSRNIKAVCSQGGGDTVPSQLSIHADVNLPIYYCLHSRNAGREDAKSITLHRDHLGGGAGLLSCLHPQAQIREQPLVCNLILFPHPGCPVGLPQHARVFAGIVGQANEMDRETTMCFHFMRFTHRMLIFVNQLNEV